jgi:hypothetical protein
MDKKEIEKLAGMIIEKLAGIVHKAYCGQYKKKHGKDYWTKGDYSLLDEETKEFDRVTVRAVLQVLIDDEKK